MSRFTEVFFKAGQEPLGNYKRYSMYTVVADGIRAAMMNSNADIEITLFCDGGPNTPGIAKDVVFNASSIAGFRPVPPEEE